MGQPPDVVVMRQVPALTSLNPIVSLYRNPCTAIEATREATSAAAQKSPHDLTRFEAELDFLLGVFGAVGAVNGIGLDRFGEVLPDRSGFGIGGVGGTHDLAIFGYRIVALEHLDDDRTRAHEFHQVLIEGSILVNLVKGLGVALAPFHPFLRNDAKTGGFDPAVDGARQIAPRRVGLDD